MKEDFLHYVWRFKKFNLNALFTTDNEPLTVVNVGQYLQSAGPDFFNAQIIINNQKWAGSVEIHLKSSDWYSHNHQIDAAYENVILHVVWEHDTNVFRRDNSVIPVLQLKDFVDLVLVESYYQLLTPKKWIYCESNIREVNETLIDNWKQRLFIERLERKSAPIFDLVQQLNADWEAVLFYQLAKNFGLNANGESFHNIARTISFTVFRKEAHDIKKLEALLLGFAGLLDFSFEENYANELKDQFKYLLGKHKLHKDLKYTVEFFKHRPDNFPTIRLSQLANVYLKNKSLFAAIVSAKSINDLYGIFNVGVSDYWQTHYQLDRISPKRQKSLSKSFIDLLIINTIVPIRFAYSRSRGDEDLQLFLNFLEAIKNESNTIISNFKALGVTVNTAIDSQALLQLKNEYCNNGRCLECAIGVELLKAPVVIL